MLNNSSESISVSQDSTAHKTIRVQKIGWATEKIPFSFFEIIRKVVDYFIIEVFGIANLNFYSKISNISTTFKEGIHSYFNHYNTWASALLFSDKIITSPQYKKTRIKDKLFFEIICKKFLKSLNIKLNII